MERPTEFHALDLGRAGVIKQIPWVSNRFRRVASSYWPVVVVTPKVKQVAIKSVAIRTRCRARLAKASSSFFLPKASSFVSGRQAPIDRR